MAENSSIGWTDHTFNPWFGCMRVSPGCFNCYAESLMDHRMHKVKWGPQGTRVKTSAAYWQRPLKWNGHAFAECEVCGWRGNDFEQALCPGCLHLTIDVWKRARQRVFCASLADVFELKPELETWRTELLELIVATPNLDWLILTKRPENILSGVPLLWHGGFPPNIWIGVSIETQREANLRIPILQKIPARVRFLSCEPLLDYIDLSMAIKPDEFAWDEVNANFDDDDEPEEFVEECEAECDWVNYGSDLVYNPEHREWVERRRANAGFKTLKHGDAIHWVICGGESGPERREMEVIWAELLKDECEQAGIPFFMKQDSALRPGQRGQIPDELWRVKQWPE